MHVRIWNKHISLKSFFYFLVFQVKEINMYKRISKTAYNQTFNPEPLRRCWKECLEKSSFHARKLDAEEYNKKNYWKKRGLAVVPIKYSIAVPVGHLSQVRLGDMSSHQKPFCT